MTKPRDQYGRPFDDLDAAQHGYFALCLLADEGINGRSYAIYSRSGQPLYGQRFNADPLPAVEFTAITFS